MYSRPKCKARHKKLLEKNTGKTLFDINHSNIILDPPPRVMKIKINKWDLIKLQSFCTAKETINKTKKTIFSHRIGENICKWCDQQVLHFQNIWIAHTTQQQRAEDLKRHFSREDI